MNRLVCPSSLPSIFAAIVASLILSGCAGMLILGGAAGVGAAVHDRRSVNTVVDDQAIEFKAAQRFSRDSLLRGNVKIHVTSYNHVVLMTGETPTEEMKSRAEKIIKGIPNVRHVQNELQIKQPVSLLSRTQDGFVTTKAKSSLFQIKKQGFDPLRVKIVTRNGNVYLMGLVTREEADEVVSHVRHISGVKRVIKVFEYIKK